MRHSDGNQVLDEIRKIVLICPPGAYLVLDCFNSSDMYSCFIGKVWNNKWWNWSTFWVSDHLFAIVNSSITSLTVCIVFFWRSHRTQKKSFHFLKRQAGASLVAQWLRICLPMQGTQVRALVWEDPTCRGATRPVSHNYWACASGEIGRASCRERV